MAGLSARRRSVISGTFGVWVTAMALGACGSAKPATSSASAGVCPPKAQRAMARFLDVSPAKITASSSTGGNGSPQCLWKVDLADGARVMTTVNVYNGPQPYFILERTIVEDSQVFTAHPLHAPPLSIAGLGLEASWFPQYPYLMATDGYRMLTVTVSWARQPQRVKRALAEAVSRPYLHTPHGKAAERVVNGYPSG